MEMDFEKMENKELVFCAAEKGFQTRGLNREQIIELLKNNSVPSFASDRFVERSDYLKLGEKVAYLEKDMEEMKNTCVVMMEEIYKTKKTKTKTEGSN